MAVKIVNLTEIFCDHRKKACIYINPAWINVLDVLQHIKKIFHIKNEIYLTEGKQDALLPDAEKIDVIDDIKELTVRLIKRPTTVMAESSPLKTMIGKHKKVMPDICNEAIDSVVPRKRKRVRKRKVKSLTNQINENIISNAITNPVPNINNSMDNKISKMVHHIIFSDDISDESEFAREFRNNYYSDENKLNSAKSSSTDEECGTVKYSVEEPNELNRIPRIITAEEINVEIPMTIEESLHEELID